MAIDARGDFPRAGNGWFDRLAAAIDRAPRRVLAAVLALHVALWGLIPALSQPNLPLDVIEQLAWGREWQWAYFKHPPLPAWILDIAAHLSGGWDRPLFFVGPLASVLALWLIWRLAADIVGHRAALVAVLLQEGVLYFNFFTPEFNHNVIQLPLWALIGWTARRAILSGRKLDWLGAGVAAALGMLGKYSTALLLLSVLLFLLLEPTARRRWRTVGPWLALAAMLVLLAPHFIAIAGLDYEPLHFPFDRAKPAANFFGHVLLPLRFAAAQLLDILGALLLAFLLMRQPRGPARENAAAAAFDRRYVAAICWGPLALALAVSAILGIELRDMWGAPFWDFLGLFIVLFLTGGAVAIGRGFIVAWLAIFLGVLIGYGVQFPGQALFGARPSRGQFPGRAVGAAVAQGWHGAEGAAPLRYVAGDVWLAGNVAFALWPARPSVMIDGKTTLSPWIDPTALACAGAVLLWHPDRPVERDQLLARFPAAQPQPDLAVPYRQWRRLPPARIGWAVVPPRGDCAKP